MTGDYLTIFHAAALLGLPEWGLSSTARWKFGMDPDIVIGVAPTTVRPVSGYARGRVIAFGRAAGYLDDHGRPVVDVPDTGRLADEPDDAYGHFTAWLSHTGTVADFAAARGVPEWHVLDMRSRWEWKRRRYPATSQIPPRTAWPLPGWRFWCAATTVYLSTVDVAALAGLSHQAVKQRAARGSMPAPAVTMTIRDKGAYHGFRLPDVVRYFTQEDRNIDHAHAARMSAAVGANAPN